MSVVQNMPLHVNVAGPLSYSLFRSGTYHGEVNKDNKPHGIGRLLLNPNGPNHIREGVWHNGREKGFCRFFYQSDYRPIFVGSVQDSCLQGEGMLILRDLNRIYIGNFDKGMPEGYG